MIFEKMCMFIVVYVVNITPFIYVIYQANKIESHNDPDVRGVSDNIVGMSMLCCLGLLLFYLLLFVRFLISIA